MIKEIKNHRSVRSFRNEPIQREILDEILMAATRASTVGTMQVYSMIVSESQQMKDKLSPCHFNQPMVRECGAVITFCADVNRFSKWCELRGTTPGYNNLAWFINGSIDALLASENLALEAEANGLGICYLGTTIYNPQQIIDILELPHGVIPITALAVGYPKDPEATNLTPRLPIESVVHYEKYTPFTPQRIEEIYHDLEQSELTQKLLKENNLPTLAHVFTQRRYTAQDNMRISDDYLKVLRNQGFMD